VPHWGAHWRRRCGLGAAVPPAGTALSVIVQVLDPPELLVAVREGVFDSSSHVHLAGLPIRLTLALMATSAAGAAGDSGPATRLYARLPPRYPMQPLLVEAVTCSELGRQWEDSCRGRLQLLADAAGAPLADGSSGGGQGCLYPLVQVLLEAVQEEQHQLEQLAADGDSAPPTAVTATGSATSSAQQQQTRQQPPEKQPEVMLLRLHHMHDRSGHCKTIRRWALALGLAGRLLFCGGSSSPLILILLEGPAEGLRQYLVRQRTQLVDVDSRGRWEAAWCCACVRGGAAACVTALLCPFSYLVVSCAWVPPCLPALVVQAVQGAHA
jgi:hypothetical protein